MLLTLFSSLIMISADPQAEAGTVDRALYADTQARVWLDAFNPDQFFRPYGIAHMSIRFRDSRSSAPLWAMNASLQCEHDASDALVCDWTFRLLEVADLPSNGSAGRKFVSHVALRLAEGARFSDALDDAGPRWLETSLAACPAAREAFGRLWSERWVPAESPYEIETLTVTSGSSPVEVDRFQSPNRYRFIGEIETGRPGGNAVALFEVVRPCMGPASEPTPWRRPFLPD